MSVEQLAPITRWTLKPVPIKTMEGVFTVKMWNQQNNCVEPIKSEPIDTQSQSVQNIKTIDLADPTQLAILASSDGCQTQSLHNNKLVPCLYNKCQKIFRDYSTMRKHLLIHGPRTHICFECGKSFLENSKLKRHQLVHNGERPFQCPACLKRFSLNYNLKTHYRIHTGDRPYICTWGGCGKQFAQLPNLKSHQLVHEKKSKLN